jgi:hypothetical protein
MVMPRRARERGGRGDATTPHVIRDQWLDEVVAFIYVPRHLCGPVALISATAVVVRSLAALRGRPVHEVVSQWGPTTFLTDRAAAPALLADFGVSADLAEDILGEVDAALGDPGLRARRESRQNFPRG